MTKTELIYLIKDLEDEDDISQVLAEYEVYRRERIEELEERQYQSGFYAFQDLVEMRRREQ